MVWLAAHQPLTTPFPPLAANNQKKNPTYTAVKHKAL